MSTIITTMGMITSITIMTTTMNIIMIIRIRMFIADYRRFST